MESSIVMTHVTSAAMSVAFINWLKSSSWFPWITQEKVKVLRYVAFVTAAIGAIGIHYTWNPAARVLSFDIPTIASMFGLGVAYVKSFAMQELTYQATKKTNVGELVKQIVAAMQGSSNPAAGSSLGPTPVK